MYFSRLIPAAAGFLGLAHATLDLGLGDGKLGLGGDKLGLDKLIDSDDGVSAGGSPAIFDLAHSWEDHMLFHGVCAPETDESPATTLGLNLHQAQLSGSINMEGVKDFLTEPTLKVGLGGVKAYVELDLSASAAVQESIELFASPKLDIGLLNLVEAELGVALALDLVLGVSAGIDLSAGFYLAFDDSAFVEISLLTKDIVDKSLEGLLAHALPIGVGADVDLSAEITLDVGLRLRSEVSVGAGLDIVGLDVGAEAVVAIWVNLFDYTAVLVGSPDCALAVQEAFGLAVGVAVELDVQALDIIDLSITPSVFVTLATAPLGKLCLDVIPEPHNPWGGNGGGLPTPTPSATLPAGNATASTTAGSGLVTSVSSVTNTYTVTSCAASVKNCPASYTQKVVTSSVDVYTTVCPATETGAPMTTSSTSSTPAPVKTITDTMTTIVPCETPTSSTFTPPSTSPPPPTVTIDDTTTVCPATETSAPAATGGPSSAPAATTTSAAAPESPAVTETPAVPTSPAAPSSEGGSQVAPTTAGGPVAPVPSPQPPQPAPVAPNGTWTSVVMPPKPSGSFTPVPPAATPTVPVGGAASLNAGLVALALPAALVALL